VEKAPELRRVLLNLRWRELVSPQLQIAALEDGKFVGLAATFSAPTCMNLMWMRPPVSLPLGPVLV